MNYKAILAIITALLAISATDVNGADIKIVSTNFDVSYSAATSYNDNFKASDSIDHAENYGFGVEMKMGITPKFRINFGFNYTPMLVHEYDAYTAWSRSHDAYFTTLYNRLQWYISRKQADGVTPMFDVAWDYQYHMYYISYMFSAEYAPLPESRFQPFITVGLAPTQFLMRGYFVSDIAGYMYKGDQFAGRWRYRVRNWQDKKNRGFFFNGFVAAGMEIMIHKNFGFHVKARYFQTIKDHFRNRITGMYNINAGLVFHQ